MKCKKEENMYTFLFIIGCIMFIYMMYVIIRPEKF
jgi:hypothetical protein